LKRLIKKHEDKIRFLLAGGWNTLVGYATFIALYFLFNKYIHYMFLVIFANILSISNAYISYKFFVFRTKGNYLKEYLRFYVVYSFSIAVNIIIMPILVEIFRIHPIMAQGLMVFITMIISYIGHKYFSFGANTMRKLLERHKQKIAFLIVGAWNTLFGYLSFMTLFFLLSHFAHYMVILIISSVINISQNYLSYKHLVFKTKGDHIREYIRFNMVNAISLSINFILLPILVEFMHIYPLIAQAPITIIIAIISYYGHKHFSFKG